jgi:cytochrome c peroxidase
VPLLPPGTPAPLPNETTDAGATLGRVLFYDKRLSANDQISCGSCHEQRLGFGDPNRFSRGFNGQTTARHSMALSDVRFNFSGRFFWDERAESLEQQVLMPIQDSIEMGQSLEDAVLKVSITPFYRPLFTAAFGTAIISSERISRALAQYLRSLTSTQSKFDRAFSTSGFGNFSVLTAQENEGRTLFNSVAGCAGCHTSNAQIASGTMNTGLDATITDPGAGPGSGRFRVPSLRNIAVSAPYMHDGRFRTLAEVVQFYDSGIQPNPALDFRLRSVPPFTPGQPPNPAVIPRRLNLTASQRAAIVAFLNTLTDSTFLTADKFSDPFVPR